MTKTEVKKLLQQKGKIQDIIPSVWIGAGYGFKISSPWENTGMDEIVYIPESVYEDNVINEEDVLSEIYAKRDFICICNGDESKASVLLDMVNWQHPETLYNELGWIEE